MRIRLLSMAVLLFLPPELCPSVGHDWSPPLAQTESLPFAVGEKLTYRIDWSPPWFLFFLPNIEAGEVQLEIAEEKGSDGRRQYKILFNARSSGTFAKLAGMIVDDHYEFLTNPETFCTERVIKRELEGKRKRDIRVEYRPAERRLYFKEFDTAFSPPKVKRDEFVENIPACVQDLFSALYSIRKKKLVQGDTHRATVGDNDKVRQVEVRVEGNENVEVPWGRYKAWKLETLAVLGGLFREGGQIHLWLTSDAKKIPVQFVVKVKLGKVTGKLKDARF